jgi:hypothetical protein
MAYTTTNTGPISSVSALAANQMPDNERVLFLLEPYQFPLFQKFFFSEGHKAQEVKNFKGLFSWFEDELYPRFTALSGVGIAGGSATQANVGLNAQIFQINDVCIVEATMQMVYITSLGSGSGPTISSMDGTTVLSAATTGVIRKVTTLDHEFAGLRPAVSTQEIQVSNYLTKFSESVAMTGRQDASEQWTDGKTFEDELQKKIREMKILYETDFKFSNAMGIKAVTGTDGYSYNATYGKGFLGFITTNKVPYTTMTEDVLDDFFGRTLNTGGSNRKTVYAGYNTMIAAGKLIKTKYAIDPKPFTTEYGVDLTRYHITGGIIDMVWDPTMDQAFADYMFLIDFNSPKKALKMRYMRNDHKGSRKFRVEENVETPGTDGVIYKILSDIGMELPNQETDGILYRTAA